MANDIFSDCSQAQLSASRNSPPFEDVRGVPRECIV